MEPENSAPLLLSPEQAAEALGGCSEWTIRKHVSQGRIRSVRLGKLLMIPREEILRIAREGLPSIRRELEPAD